MFWIPATHPLPPPPKKKKKLTQNDKRIGLPHATKLHVKGKNETQYGDFVIASTLSHQLLPSTFPVLDIKKLAIVCKYCDVLT